MMKKLYWYAILLLVAGGICSVHAAPTVSQIGGAVVVSGAGGLRGTIATDSANIPHVATTEAPSSGFYFSDWNGSAFATTRYNALSIFNSSQFGGPHMEIDANDTAWISATFWWPNMGIGITVRPNIKGNPGAYPSFNSEDIWKGPYDVANLSLDPAALGRCYFASHRGVWEEYTYNSAGGYIYQSGEGSVNDGAGGEKAYFWVGKAGSVLHADGQNCAVKHHATEYSYNNSLRAANGYGYYKWADWNAYPGMLVDHAYPSVVSDSKNPLIAYMVAEYLRFAPYGIYMNIWKGTDNLGNGDCVFPSSRLLCLDPNGQTGVGGRYEVQQYPANNGGVWVSWIRGGRAKLRYVPSNTTSINDCGPEVDVCDAGIVMSICVDKNGDIHMLYYNGGVCYRKLDVSGDSAASSGMYLPGNYDGDGLDDICVYYPQDGTWSICYNDYGTFNRVEIIKFGYAEAQAVPGDYDGDGITDLAVFHAPSGTWTIRPSSDTNHPVTKQLGWSETIPVPGNYLGSENKNDVPNDMTDLAVFEPGNGTWSIICSETGELVQRQLGYSGVAAVPADYNGDGYVDIALFDRANGAWWGMDARTGSILPELNGVNFGWSAVTPVPGDYDSDGSADRAVYYEGEWNIWLSRTSELETFRFGSADYLPVPGRYFNTARAGRRMTVAQPGVYMPSNGEWFLQDILEGQMWIQKAFGWSEALPPNL